jgi:hypothetical protein
MSASNDTRFEKLKRAFDSDGYDVRDLNTVSGVAETEYVQSKGYLEFQSRIGIMAVSRTAVVGEHVNEHGEKEHKKAYYVEGTPYQMGFLLGLMAEPEVKRMTTEYTEKIIPAFFEREISDNESNLVRRILGIVVDLIGEATDKMEPDIPDTLEGELAGILAGCNEVDPSTEVKEDDLKALNYGIDYLVAHIYKGTAFQQKDQRIPAALLKAPVMCNSYSLSGEIVKDGKHYFGRDFQFPTADVFQDVACMIIYNPLDSEDGAGNKLLPLISQTAPGFVGSCAAMNVKSVAMGVHMLPSSHTNPKKPGLNSLLMVRHCIQTCDTIDYVVKTITESQRGGSWLYPVVDGKSDKACIVEAVATGDLNYHRDIPDRYRDEVPDESFFQQARQENGIMEPDRGVMVRWGDYPYPAGFITHNKKLWDVYNEKSTLWARIKDVARLFLDSRWSDLKDVLELFLALIRFLLEAIKAKFTPGPKFAPEKRLWSSLKRFIILLSRIFRDPGKKVDYHDRYFDTYGFINDTRKDRNCPGWFFFTPQREERKNVVIAANQFITPELAMTAMGDWIAILAGHYINGFQWRYDKMNKQIETAISKGDIDATVAQELIDFLRPTDDNLDLDCRYFYRAGPDDDPLPIIIEGSVSLFELKDRWVKSHYGYYGDGWVEIHLDRYVT